MAGELQINGEYAGPWKLVASSEATAGSSLSAYTTTQYKRLLFRMYNAGTDSTVVYPYFYFLDDTGSRRTDNYLNKMFVSYGTGYYSNQQSNSIWSPGWLSSNLRYDSEVDASMFEMLFFNVETNRPAGYIAQWSYRTTTNIRVSGIGGGTKDVNIAANPIYGIEMAGSSTTFNLRYPKIEVYGDTTLT